MCKKAVTVYVRGEWMGEVVVEQVSFGSPRAKTLFRRHAEHEMPKIGGATSKPQR